MVKYGKVITDWMDITLCMESIDVFSDDINYNAFWNKLRKHL